MAEAEAKTRCPECRKKPRNCLCYELRLEPMGGQVWLFVDNMATEPVRGQERRLWQPRRNAKVWVRPTYVDGYGPIMKITDSDLANEVREAIDNGSFFLENYKGRDGADIWEFDRDLLRRLPFLRKPRPSRRRSVAASKSGFISCT